MDRFYERREKFQDIPELRPFPADTLTLPADAGQQPAEPNIQVYYREEDRNGIVPADDAFDQFQQVSTELGYTLFLPQYFAYGVAKLVQKEVVGVDELQVASRLRKDVSAQYAQVKERLDGEFDLHLAEGRPFMTLRREIGRISLLDEFLGDPELRNIADAVSRLQLVIRYSNERSRTVQQEGDKVLSVITHSPLDRKSLTIDVSDSAADPVSRAFSDATLETEGFNAANVSGLMGIFKEKLRRREAAPRTSEFLVANTLDAKNMPHHPIFQAIKHQLEPRIFGHEADTLFDPMDLLYQVSFRLTCFKLGEIFSDYEGGYFEPDEQLIDGMTALQDYNFVRQFSGVKWGAYQLNGELVDKLVHEQLLLAQERYQQSNTDVATVLGREGALAKDGWYLISQDDRIFAIRDDDTDDILEVSFAEIDPEVASDYHATYHYIHGPRASRSFGLFLEGSDQPFTIAAIDGVDRDYKKEALLLLGYDYENCVDFTRLYSLPGVPKLSSSTISRLIKRQLLAERPNMQAAISTFMPTYANSNSMFACGFDKVFLLKRNRHKFAARPDLGDGVYEHLTNRRAGDRDVISSRQVLLPVVELLSEIKRPRFKPYVDINKSMMIRSDTR